MQREILTRTLIAGALIAIVFLGILYLPSSQQQTAPYMDNYDGNAIRVELYIYKNDQLIYYDPDDPAVKNLAYLLAELIAGDVVSGWKNVAGAARNRIANSNNPGFVFISYDTSYAYSYGMNNLPASYETGQISSGGVTFDDAEKSVTFSATVNVQIGGNITGVGLYTNITPDNYATAQSFLLFYDELNQPIHVNPGDIVTVVYKIVVP